MRTTILALFLATTASAQDITVRVKLPPRPAAVEAPPVRYAAPPIVYEAPPVYLAAPRPVYYAEAPVYYLPAPRLYAAPGGGVRAGGAYAEAGPSGQAGAFEFRGPFGGGFRRSWSR